MGLSPAQQEQLKTVLEGLKPLATPAVSGQPRVSIPGQVGGPPGQLVGQPAGVQPQGVLGLPTQGGAATTGSAPPTRTPLPSSPFVGTPLPQPAGPTTPGGSTVYGAVQNITAVLNAHKEKEEQKLTRRAEVLTRSLQDAIDRRDAAAIDEILTPANKAILKKAGIGEPPEIRETTPEEKGVMNGLKHKIVTTPTAGEQASSVQAQRNLEQQQAALKTVQGDPKLASAMGLGTTLSGEELHKQERYAGELEPSAVVTAQMSAAEKANSDKLRFSYAELHASTESENAKLSYTLAQSKLEAAQRHDDAVLMKGLERERLDIGYQYNKERLDALDKVQGAKTKSAVTTANKLLLDSTEKYITAQRAELSKLRSIKDPTDEVTQMITAKQQALEAQEKSFNTVKNNLAATLAEQEMQSLVAGSEPSQ